jgi:hypothetical protein
VSTERFPTRNTLCPMSDANGSTHRPDSGPSQNPQASPGADPDPQPGLVNEPVTKTTIPLKIMLVSVVALLVTITGVAFLVTRTAGTPTPTETPMVADPTGVPVLPVRAGEYARDPGTATAPPDFGVDRSILTSSAYYRRNGDNALIAVGARPVPDEKALLDQIKVLAQRQVGDGWCGREESTGFDVCVLRRNRTAILAIGLRDQTPEEIMAATRLILEGTN